MEDKLTAVEWFAQQVNSSKWKFADITDRQLIIDQAKKMEKESKWLHSEKVKAQIDVLNHYANLENKTTDNLELLLNWLKNELKELEDLK